MKILFQSRVDLYNPRGGDTAQMEHTKSAIEKMDPQISIDIDNRVQNPNIEKYDIVHLFNLDWIPETYLQSEWAKKHNKKVVLSAIHHSEKEVIKFEEKAAYDIRKLYNAIFRWQSARDVGKNIYRSLFNPEKIYPTFIQFIKGIRNTQRKILENSDVVLVQTRVEADDIRQDFNFTNFKWEKVVNGVDIKVFDKASPAQFNDYIQNTFNLDIDVNPIILNVGRIEPRKNQISLINAFKDLKSKGHLKEYKLIFIGANTRNSPGYVDEFEKLISNSKNDYIIATGALSQDLVASAMAHTGIYVHPSWFETTGLVTLEAALAGMNVAATGNRTKEYLGNSAFYFDPEDPEGIKNAIMDAVHHPKDMTDIKEKIKAEYTWENTARQTIDIYNRLLSNESNPVVEKGTIL